jgi:hypothetical protein
MGHRRATCPRLVPDARRCVVNLTDYPTPKSDAVAETRIVKGKPREIVDADFARDLERQLAEAREQSSKWQYKATRRFKEICRIKRRVADAREQRDRLAEALRQIKRFAATKASHLWLGRIADEALATLDRKEDA